MSLYSVQSMDLRMLPDGLSGYQRVEERRKRVQEGLGIDLSSLQARESSLGRADEINCEQMIGHIPIPVGIAGPLRITLSDGSSTDCFLPLATTEGALVASVNRGCKALREAGYVTTSSVHHGVTRSIAFKSVGQTPKALAAVIEKRTHEWKQVGESTSAHLVILGHDIDTDGAYVFLTLRCNTDEAMGMNMITLAAQAIGDWMAEHVEGCALMTVAGNIDSDKKPSVRTHDRGRGYESRASAHIPNQILRTILKSSADSMYEVANAKLTSGSRIAGAIGKNLHAANIIAALYLATGQDAAHTVEGSLTDTEVTADGEGIVMSVRCPAILVGVRGGGTALPAQKQALSLLLKPASTLHPCAKLAETIAAAVLAGEVSLLAAQASQSLASAHRDHGR